MCFIYALVDPTQETPGIAEYEPIKADAINHVNDINGVSEVDMPTAEPPPAPVHHLDDPSLDVEADNTYDVNDTFTARRHQRDKFLKLFRERAAGLKRHCSASVIPSSPTNDIVGDDYGQEENNEDDLSPDYDAGGGEIEESHAQPILVGGSGGVVADISATKMCSPNYRE